MKRWKATVAATYYVEVECTGSTLESVEEQAIKDATNKLRPGGPGGPGVSSDKIPSETEIVKMERQP